MALIKLLPRCLFQVAFLISFLLGPTLGGGLKVRFYDKSCPQAEAIVRDTVNSYFSQDPTVSAPLLRLHFHDCFVRGCDGSVLLNSTRTNKAEKDAKPNQTLDGFYVIDAAKAALEKACPATVSCADILALAARDAVSLATGFRKKMNLTKENLYQVETGRRDGFLSKATEAEAHLPSSDDNIAILKANFASKGLDSRDLAILSVELLEKCRPGNSTIVEMVPGSSTTFDTKYYELVARRRGLFHSDAALMEDEVTRDYVYSSLKLPASSFFVDFGESMIKMGKAGVLTGKSGEIRKNCALVNH